MNLVWMMIPLILFGVIEFQQSLAEDSDLQYGEYISLGNTWIEFTYSIANPPPWQMGWPADSDEIEIAKKFYDKFDIKIIDVIKSHKNAELCEATSCLSGTYHILISYNDVDKYNNIDFRFIKNLPPSKQITNGLELHEVICKERLELIFKSSDNSPACVKKNSTYKLYERGWNPWPIISTNHSVELTTNKSVYALGEPIIVSLKNIGVTKAWFSNGAYGIGFFNNDQFICCTSSDVSMQLHPDEEFIYKWLQYGMDSSVLSSGEYQISTSYNTFEGRGQLSTTVIIDDQIDSEFVHTVISTDKPSYQIGEKIIITMENIGTIGDFYSSIPVGFAVTDENDNYVLGTQGPYEAGGSLEPGIPLVYEWDQTNQDTGIQVEPGIFKITTHTGQPNEVSHYFTIELEREFTTNLELKHLCESNYGKWENASNSCIGTNEEHCINMNGHFSYRFYCPYCDAHEPVCRLEN